MSWRAPSRLIYATLLCVAAAIVKNNADPDLWGYLAFGRLFFEEPGFPYTDVFSYVPTRTVWVYHEWLTGVIFYPVYKVFGGTGLQVMRYAAASLTLGLAFMAARTRLVPSWSCWLAILLAVFVWAMGYNPVRAQIFTFLFFSLELFILERARHRQTWASFYWFIPIFILWANLHGGFVLGLGFFLVYAAGALWERKAMLPYVLAFFGAGLATLINPYGFSLWPFLFESLTLARPEILEWLPVWRTLELGYFIPPTLMFFLLAVIAFSGLAFVEKTDPTALLVLVATAVMGVLSHRFVVFFALAFMVFSPPGLALLFDPTLGRQKKWSFRAILGPGLICLALASCLVFFVKHFSMDFHSGNPLTLRTPSEPASAHGGAWYPIKAMGWITQNRSSGKILPDFHWGEFILFFLSPHYRVAMDGRFETVYPEEVRKQYFDFYFARPGWRDFLDQYPHDMILLEKETPAASLLRNHPGWKIAFQDNGSLLFVPNRIN